MNDIELIYAELKAIFPRLTPDVVHALSVWRDSEESLDTQSHFLSEDIEWYYRSVDYKANVVKICALIRSEFALLSTDTEIIDYFNDCFDIFPLLEFTHQDVASIFVKDLTPDEANFILNNGDLFNTELCKHLRTLPQLVSYQF